MSRVFLLAFFLFITSISLQSHAQTGKLIVRGTVVDPAGKGLSEAQIEVYSADSTVVLDTVCDSRGIYRLDLDYDQIYYVLVTKLGYCDKAFNVNSFGLYGEALLKHSVVNDVKVELMLGNAEFFTEPSGIVTYNYSKQLFEAMMIMKVE